MLDFPPNLFIAIASVSCASLEIDPYDIAPVLNLFTISDAGSTSSNGIGFSANSKSNNPLKVNPSSSFIINEEYSLNFL